MTYINYKIMTYTEAMYRRIISLTYRSLRFVKFQVKMEKTTGKTPWPQRF